MRKDIFTRNLKSIVIVFVVALGILSGMFSFVSLPVSNSDEPEPMLLPQGVWADDDAKTYNMNVSQDRYGDVPGGWKDWAGPFNWTRSQPESPNEDAWVAKNNLESVSLLAKQGNAASLSFKIKRRGFRNEVNTKINEDRDVKECDGYTVNWGRLLVYLNGKVVASPEYNFVNGNFDFTFTTSSLNLQWNTNYEVKLVLAWKYYNWYHHDLWYYKGVATTTVRFNDTIKPTGTLIGVADGGETAGEVLFKWDDARATAKLNGTNYIKNSCIAKEGNYTMILTDQVGLFSTYTFKIDRTAPASNFNYSLYGAKMYTAGDIIFAPTDNLSEIVQMAVKFQENGEWAYSQGDAERLGYKVEFYDDRIIVPNEENNGEWYFQAVDSVGNTSKAECVVLMVMSFGNQWRIRESYKQNTWYNVSLPMSIFGEQAGIYAAASYETALAFATAKEWEFRVSVVANGWMYVSAANGNLSQLYTEKDALDVSVNKYANSYISERKIAKNGGNVFSNIINDELALDETALTRQHLENRFFMTLDLPIYFMDVNFKFEAPKVAVETFVKVQMIGNDYDAVERNEVLLNYDTAVGPQIFASGNNAQGYYLVTEWDTAGNAEQYYVYLDISAPILETYVTYGDGRQETVTFTEDLVAEYSGTFRYISLDLSEIHDFIDDYATIKITGRKLNEVYFVQGDELPFLDGIDYYGNYTIELYDRSGNTLNFVISIAGEVPYLATSSLTSETSCRLTLNVNDRTNSITELKLYRILYDGTYVQMLQDHKEVVVGANTLQYTLLVGGKYTLWYKDLYGRVVECTPIFYMKGLPSGTLSGVIEGGMTNKNVSLKFDDKNKLVLYKVENGERTEVSVSETFSCVFDETSHKVTATLTANEETSASYIFFLYNADEISLFVEYKFTIDCIIAPVYIYNSSGADVAKNSFTNKPFSIYWNEIVTLRYYTDTTPGGELGAVRYEMGKSLTADSTYYFTLRDAVGNTETFTILLDSVVSYQLGGEFVQLGEHNYLAKNDLQFTITEKNAVQIFDPTPAVVNGGLITLEGNYTIDIIDAYGNAVTIHICIDKTAPVILLDGVEDGGYTKNFVKVTAFDVNAIFLVNKNNQILVTLEDGAVFDNEGSYRIMAQDEAGNMTIATFTINRSVPYESNVADTEITTGAVTFKFLGTLESENIRRDDVQITAKTKYTEAGVYLITAVDYLGNEFYFSFTILPTRVRELYLDLNDVAVDSATKDKLAYMVNIVNNTLTLTDQGSYVLNLKNTKKNLEYSIALTVDNSVTFSSSIPNNSFTAADVEITFGETVTQEVKCEGKTITSKKKYTQPGNYEITATDDLGNEIVLRFQILPARMRELHLENLVDIELLLATKNGDKIAVAIENDQLYITGSGRYILFFQRVTGEVFNFICDVDDIPPTVNIIKDAGSFKTANASKDNVTAVLTCNGETLAYSLGRRHNGAGVYTLTLTDDLGNQNVYTFTITEPLNWAAYASFAGLGLLAAVVVIVVLLAKRRVKTR